jgi:TolA-binding protein
MKLEPALLQTIRAAAKAQPGENNGWRYKAAEAFLKKETVLHYKLRKLQKQIADLRKKIEPINSELRKLLNQHGITTDNDEMFRVAYGDDAEQKFTKAGGKIANVRKWTAEAVIARLAAAAPKDRGKILKEYGINWE